MRTVDGSLAEVECRLLEARRSEGGVRGHWRSRTPRSACRAYWCQARRFRSRRGTRRWRSVRTLRRGAQSAPTRMRREARPGTRRQPHRETSRRSRTRGRRRKRFPARTGFRRSRRRALPPFLRLSRRGQAPREGRQMRPNATDGGRCDRETWYVSSCLPAPDAGGAPCARRT